MFNLKEKSVNPQGISSNEILSKIRSRLGIQDDAQNQGYDADLRQSNQENNSQAQSVLTNGANVVTHQKWQSRMQPEQQSQSNDAEFDDFSFDLDFTDAKTTSQTNANKAYRAYQNAMKSSYSNNDAEQDSNDFSAPESNHQVQSNSSNNVLNFSDINFDEESDNIEDYNQNEEGSDIDFSSTDEFESDDAEYDQQELDEDAEELDGYEIDEDNYNDTDASHTDEFTSNDSDISFDLPQNFNSLNNQNASPINFSGNMENMLASVLKEQASLWLNSNMQSEFVQGEISKWCDANLENICREVIRQELYKQK